MATRTLEIVQSELLAAVNAPKQDADLIRKLSDEEESLRVGQPTDPIAVAPEEITPFVDTGSAEALVEQQRAEAQRSGPGSRDTSV